MIHRARLLTRARSATRNAQGEFGPEPGTDDAPETGPWFDCRLMQSKGVSPERRRNDSTASRAGRTYEFLCQPIADDGTPIVLTASSLVETECDLLGSPVIELDGEPEFLNNGDEAIGWMAYATIAKDRS